MYRLVLLLVCCLAGCNGPSRLSAVPQPLTERITVLSIPNARFWADTDGPAMVQGPSGLGAERAIHNRR
jgi:hypothetical protein